jgi:hypothetical protein
VSLATVVLAAVLAAATSVHLPVSTNDPQAQASIDNGLFLYYAYNGTDAARSFARAAALEPRLAMAYWGMALGDGPDLNTAITAERFDQAAAAIRQASALAAALPARERSLVTIMAQRYRGSFENWASDDAAYREAMLVFAKSSQDENVELLAAEALLEAGGLAWQHGTLASEESREALDLVTMVLRSDPSSVMANHLCIHLYDLAPDRSPAQECAQRLDAAVFPPEAEHLAHMPAHYWIETGNYRAALSSSERSYALLQQIDESAPSSEHVSHYAKHDVAVGYSAAMMLGNYVIAELWARRMASVFGTGFDSVTALRFGRYEAAYAANANEFGGSSVHGLAALALGHSSEAHLIAARLRGGNLTQGYLPQLLLARVAEADGKYDEAERWIARSKANQLASFAGELIPLLPADEALGDLRLRHGDNNGAIAAFTDALAAYPNDPRALFGLATATAATGDNVQAAAARARFDAEWEGADTQLDGTLLL